MAKYLVSVAGNIGVGKTTLTQLLGERCGWKTFYEEVLNNPYLSDFYADMRRWSFSLQVYFFTHRFRIFEQMVAETASCVQDRTIYEDLEIFARTLNEQGFLDNRDYHNFRSLFESMIRFLPAPDLIVYLQASPEFLLRRIHARGRGFEKGITLEYLQGLHRAYEEWVSQASGSLPFLIVDAESFDIQHPDDVQKTVDLICRRCAEG